MGLAIGIGNGILFTNQRGQEESFLLDEYPNTTGSSYSLRNLTSTTTNVIRVRRSSDNLESDFTATGITDGTLTTFCAGGQDGFVTTWYDQSQSNHLQQITALEQPKIVSIGAVILQNGKPCISFDGSNDSLLIGGLYPSFPNPQSYDLFMVNQQTSSLYSYGLSASINNSFRWNGLEAFLRGKGADISFLISVYAQNLFYIAQNGIIGGISELYMNGVTKASGSNGGTFLNRIHLGENGDGSSNGEIKMQEFILYVEQSQALNKTEIENNINSYYSIY